MWPLAPHGAGCKFVIIDRIERYGRGVGPTVVDEHLAAGVAEFAQVRVSAKPMFLGVSACLYPCHVNTVNIGFQSLRVLTCPPSSLTISMREMGR